MAWVSKAGQREAGDVPQTDLRYGQAKDVVERQGPWSRKTATAHMDRRIHRSGKVMRVTGERREDAGSPNRSKARFKGGIWQDEARCNWI